MPIKAVATELGLPLQQINNFQSWYRHWWDKNPYSLVIAVSFGLLVPAGFLDKAKYGGLNVHPSLLPDLRGSAPITHALLKRRPETGVSLQTMHPTKFDHGVVLKQSVKVPVTSESTQASLIQQLGPLGAELLCKGIEENIFVPPLDDVRDGIADPPWLELAPKISSKDRQIDWNRWTANDILLRHRALGELWDNETFQRCQSSESGAYTSKRVTFHGTWHKMDADSETGVAGQPVLVLSPFRQGLTMAIRTVDDFLIAPESVTIEGKGRGKGLQPLNEQLQLRRKGQNRRPTNSNTYQ